MQTKTQSIDDHPPLQIVLHKDLGKLPSGISIELPSEVSSLLVMKRLAVPVANLFAMADLALTEDDLDHVGVDLWAVEAA
jgi:hypothetical protein